MPNLFFHLSVYSKSEQDRTTLFEYLYIFLGVAVGIFGELRQLPGSTGLSGELREDLLAQQRERPPGNEEKNRLLSPRKLQIKKWMEIEIYRIY